MFSFGDSFDCYALPADTINGYWDSGTVNGQLAAGRFSGSQCWAMASTNGAMLVKNSGANDAVHHLVVAYRQTAVISGTSLYGYLQLSDGATAQCCVVFRSDGAVLLTSGAPTGTVLDTYPSAVLVAGTWYAFEIEIVINNTTGSWAVRRNGSASNDRALGGLDTQNSVNAYANRLTVGAQVASNSVYFDDLFWRSDASTVDWMGDLRCYTDAGVRCERAVVTDADWGADADCAGSAHCY